MFVFFLQAAELSSEDESVEVIRKLLDAGRLTGLRVAVLTRSRESEEALELIGKIRWQYALRVNLQVIRKYWI